MSQIITHSTPTEQWQQLVHCAEESCHQDLDEDLESYLVFLLMRQTGNTELADSILASQYLQGMQSEGQNCIQQLQEVGDQCLIYSGLFPKRSRRRLVKVSYYVDLGRSSYIHIAGKMKQGYATLYEHLSEYFVVLMDVLQAMRSLNSEDTDNNLLLELSLDCNSERAANILAENNIITFPRRK